MNQILTLKNTKNNLSNLTPIQASAFTLLKQNKYLIIKPTNKNLGPPALMDLDTYMQQVLREHLLSQDYTQLSYHEVTTQMDTLKQDLKNIINTNQDTRFKAELTYFNRSLKAHF
jgi:hypothetical protein